MLPFFSLLAGSSYHLIITEAAFNADFTLVEGTWKLLSFNVGLKLFSTLAFYAKNIT